MYIQFWYRLIVDDNYACLLDSDLLAYTVGRIIRGFWDEETFIVALKLMVQWKLSWVFILFMSTVYWGIEVIVSSRQYKLFYKIDWLKECFSCPPQLHIGGFPYYSFDRNAYFSIFKCINTIRMKETRKRLPQEAETLLQ